MAYDPVDIDIANMALNLIGNQQTVTSVTSTADAVDTAISTWFEYVRRYTLAQHDWNFARKRIRLGEAHQPAPADLESSDYLASVDSDALEVAGWWAYRYRYPVDCVKLRKIENPVDPRGDGVHHEVRQTSVLDTTNSTKITNITKASPGVISTDTAHGFVAGDVVFITAIKEAADAEDLTDMTEIDGRLLAVKTATGTATFSIKHVLSGDDFDTSNYTTYNTTEDNGRVMKVLQGARCVLVNHQDAVAIYTKYETDPDLYPPHFIEQFARNLAERIVMPLTADRLLLREIQRENRRFLYESRGVDAQEGMDFQNPDADWIDARDGGHSWPDWTAGRTR